MYLVSNCKYNVRWENSRFTITFLCECDPCSCFPAWLYLNMENFIFSTKAAVRKNNLSVDFKFLSASLEYLLQAHIQLSLNWWILVHLGVLERTLSARIKCWEDEAAATVPVNVFQPVCWLLDVESEKRFVKSPFRPPISMNSSNPAKKTTDDKLIASSVVQTKFIFLYFNLFSSFNHNVSYILILKKKNNIISWTVQSYLATGRTLNNFDSFALS